MPNRGLPEHERRGVKQSGLSQKRIKENLRNLQFLGTLAFVTLGIIGWATYSYLTDPTRPIPTSECPGGFSRVSTTSGLETPIPAAIAGPENLFVVPRINGVDVYAWRGLAESVPHNTNIDHSNPSGKETFTIKPPVNGKSTIVHTICRK